MQLFIYIYHPAVNDNVLRPVFCKRCCSLKSTTVCNISGLIDYLVCIIDDPEFVYMSCDLNTDIRNSYSRLNEH